MLQNEVIKILSLNDLIKLVSNESAEESLSQQVIDSCTY
jgi:hypothetical protein